MNIITMILVNIFAVLLVLTLLKRFDPFREKFLATITKNVMRDEDMMKYIQEDGIKQEMMRKDGEAKRQKDKRKEVEEETTELVEKNPEKEYQKKMKEHIEKIKERSQRIPFTGDVKIAFKDGLGFPMKGVWLGPGGTIWFSFRDTNDGKVAWCGGDPINFALEGGNLKQNLENGVVQVNYYYEELGGI